MKKRFLFLFAILTMLCTCFLFASAQENETVIVDNVVYQLISASGQEDEHYEVISFFDSVETKKSKTEISIPSEISGIPVTAIEYDNSYSNGYSKSVVEKITLPDTIKTIGTKAFVYMRSLNEINIPIGVKTIGRTAFSHCSGLTKITIPESVRKIDRYCFEHCTSLKQVSVVGNGLKIIGGWSFYDCSNLESINLPNSLVTIGRMAFQWCALKTTIRIPGKCEVRGEAFAYTKNIKKVVFEDRKDKSDSFIGNLAFFGCSVEKVYLPKKSVEFKIPFGAFQACRSLTSVYRTENVKSIDSWAFYACVSLKTFTVSEKIESIFYDAFGHTNLTKLRVLTTNKSFVNLAKSNAEYNFLKKLPADCKIYVKTKAMRNAFIDAGCKGKVIVKSDLK